MATEVQMPKNGMDMTEGTIIRWLKKEGDPVEKNEPLMEIETDKITMEAESPVSGILLKRLYEEGAVVPVLTTVAYVGEAGEEIFPEAKTVFTEAGDGEGTLSAAEVRTEKMRSETEEAEVAATPFARKLAADYAVDLHQVSPGGSHGEVRAKDVEEAVKAQPKATPLARAMAADQGIDLSRITGSGYNGKIFSSDLTSPVSDGAEEVKTPETPEATGTLRACSAEEKGEGITVGKAIDAAMAEIEEVMERRGVSGMRRVIAERMTASHREIPGVTQNIRVDVTNLFALREAVNRGREKNRRISVNDFLIKAVGIVVEEQERFRMTWEGDHFALHRRIHIGMAVGMEDGLLVPVLRDVDRKSLLQISKEARELAGKAREGRLRPDEVGDGRITISNIGMYGIHSFTPIINQPEAAIVGVCSPEEELALIDGQVAVRKKMMLCVTYDHRILNATEVCRFELRLKELLEEPLGILLGGGAKDDDNR